MAFYDKFPYTNFQEINLDIIIQELVKVQEGLQFVIDNSSLKYADPIQWSITSQYQANTVVIDPATGIAYLSVQPVPVNILITNADYWTPIFSLEELFQSLDNKIDAVEETLTTAVTAESTARTEADTALGNDITAEIIARTEADTAINERIDSVIYTLSYPNFDIRKYGAVGDGYTNDTQAFKDCMEANGIVYLPAFDGAVYLLDSIELTGNNTVVGTKTPIKQNQETLFRISGSNVTIKGLEISSRDTCISIEAVTSIEDILIDDVVVQNCRTLLSDLASTTTYTRLYLNRVTAQKVTGIGVNLEHGRAFIFMNDVTIDKVGIVGADPCFRFINNQGMHLVRCEAEGGGSDGSHTAAVGFFFQNCAAVWLERCMADTVDGSGFYLNGDQNRYFYFVSCVASLMFGHAFFLSGIDILMTNCAAFGRTGMPAYISGANGLYSFASYVNVSNMLIAGMTGLQMALASGANYIMDGISLQGGNDSMNVASGVTGYLSGGITSHTNVTVAATGFKYAIMNGNGAMLRNDLT